MCTDTPSDQRTVNKIKARLIVMCCLVIWVPVSICQTLPWNQTIAQALNEYNKGRFVEAERLYVQAEKQAETFGAQDRRLAATLNNLADLYVQQAKYNEAAPLYRRSVQILQHYDGQEQVRLATALSNLAGLYTRQNKSTEAEALFEQALTIRRKVLCPDDPDVADSLTNLAELYREQRRFPEAEKLFQQAIQQAMRKSEQAAGYYGLARIALAQDNPDDAETLLEQTLELEPEASIHAWALVYLGKLKLEVGEREKAAICFQDALKVEGATDLARTEAQKGLQQISK